jgi:hypothetical protein
MALNYTNIQHNFRKENNLSLNEYVLCDMIFFLSKKSDSKVPNWCYMSKETMAKEIGLSKQSIITLIKKLCDLGYVEKQEVTGFVKTTPIWELVYFTDGKESLPLVQKVFNFGKESLPNDGKESLPNNNTYNNNNIENRKLKFSETLKDFVEIYGSDFIKEFYDYWTEPNKSNTKFKQELQTTWSLERRLSTWAKNEINFNKLKNGKSKITDSEEFKNLIKNIRSTGERI